MADKGRCQTCRWTAENWLGHARIEVWQRLGRLRLGLANVQAMPNASAEWSAEYRAGYDKAMSRVRAEVARTLALADATDDASRQTGGAA